jgi:hypothetical protein
MLKARRVRPSGSVSTADGTSRLQLSAGAPLVVATAFQVWVAERNSTPAGRMSSMVAASSSMPELL